MLLFLPDIMRDILGFLIGRIKLAEGNLFSVRIFGPEALFLAGRIVSDHGIGRIQNALCGAVVLLQFDHARIRKMVFKIQNVIDVRAAEFVDRLVVIPHHTKVLILRCQKPDQFELRGIRVLILIHHDVAEFLLIVIKHLFVQLKKLHGEPDQIIKIQRVALFQRVLIFPVNPGDPLFLIVISAALLIFLRADEFILGGGDRVQKNPLPHQLCVNFQTLADIAHHGFLVIAVINGKITVISQSVNISSKNPYT